LDGNVSTDPHRDGRSENASKHTEQDSAQKEEGERVFTLLLV
jgi:hypothetical protein